MSLVLTASPIKTVNSVLSNVNAAITQLPYTFERQDATWIGTQNGATFVRLNMDLDPTSDFSVGDSIWYGNDAGDSQVTVISAVSATHIDTSQPISSGFAFVGPGWVNNLTKKPDYAVEIQVLDTALLLLINEVFIYKPSQAGNLFVDLGGILTTIMENNLVAFQRYIVAYRENYTGIDVAYTNTGEALAILGERSIGRSGGSNMWDLLLRTGVWFRNGDKLQDMQSLQTGFTPFVFTNGKWVMQDPITDADGNSETLAFDDIIQVGSFLMRFTYRATNTGGDGNVTLDRRMPNTQSSSNLIADGNINEATMTFNPPAPDSPFGFRVNPTATQGTIDTFEVFSINVEAFSTGNFLTRFKEPKLWQGFLNQTIGFIVDSNFVSRTGEAGAQTAENAADINRENPEATITKSYSDTPAIINHILNVPDSAYNQIVVRGTSTAVSLSERIFLPVLPACKNPIMVEWVNSLGAIEHYLFNINQDVVLEASEGTSFDAPFDQDIENINRQTTRLSSDEIMRLVCSADHLTKNDITALAEMKTAEFVDVWITNDGVEKIGVVVVDSFSTSYGTKQNSGSFTVTLQFPNDYRFFDLKQY